MSKPNQPDSQRQDTGKGANKENQGITSKDSEKNQPQEYRQDIQGQRTPGSEQKRSNPDSINDEFNERSRRDTEDEKESDKLKSEDREDRTGERRQTK